MKQEIFYDGFYYDVTKWVDKHPGGSVIKYFTEHGEDATHAFQQFHHRSTKKANLILNSLEKRPADKTEIDDTNKLLTADFLKLYKDLEDEGMFTPSPIHMAYRMAEWLSFYLIGYYFFSIGYDKLGIFCLVMFQGRCGWLQHEMGHSSYTGNPKIDNFLHSVCYGIGYGLSGAWWKMKHNKHHAMPQRFERDVDIDALPYVAFNTLLVKDKKDGQGWFVQNQAILFLLVDVFLGSIYWRALDSPRYALKKGKYGDLFFMGIHYLLIPAQFGILNYLFISYFTYIYLFGHFSLNHTHLEVTDKPAHWVEYGLIHTANITPNPLVNWWMGYLNFQIEHHLFPQIPQFRHPLIAERVRKLAECHGIPYLSYGYFEAIQKSTQNLWEVSIELKTEHEEENKKRK